MSTRLKQRGNKHCQAVNDNNRGGEFDHAESIGTSFGQQFLLVLALQKMNFKNKTKQQTKRNQREREREREREMDRTERSEERRSR